MREGLDWQEKGQGVEGYGQYHSAVKYRSHGLVAHEPNDSTVQAKTHEDE